MWLDVCVLAKLLQLCPTLCSPMECSPPDSSVHGILQVRIQEWLDIELQKMLSAFQFSLQLRLCFLYPDFILRRFFHPSYKMVARGCLFPLHISTNAKQRSQDPL